MTYKGYSAEVFIDLEAHKLRGRVADIRETITFEGDFIHDLEMSFRKSVDTYLAACLKGGIEPEHPPLIGTHLYKFRCFSNPTHLRTITHNEVWFAAPDSLNDPFDCNIPIRVNDCPEEWQLEQMIEYAMSALGRSRAEAEEGARRELEAERGSEDMRELRRHQLHSEVSPKTGILSLASHWRHKRAKLMWTHYADSHSGFVVGFDQNATLSWMREISGAPADAITFSAESGLQVRWIAVEYMRRMPRLLPCKMSPAEIVQAVVTNKANDWSYEDEKRMLMMKVCKNANLLPLSDSDRLQQLPGGVVTEITLGVNVSPANADLIKTLLQYRNPAVKLYQAHLSDDEFDLEREEIPL